MLPASRRPCFVTPSIAETIRQFLAGCINHGLRGHGFSRAPQISLLRLGRPRNYFAVHFDPAPHNVHMPDLGQLKYELIFRHTHPPPRKCLFFSCMFGSERDAKLSYLINLQSKMKMRTVISIVNKTPEKRGFSARKSGFLAVLS